MDGMEEIDKALEAEFASVLNGEVNSDEEEPVDEVDEAVVNEEPQEEDTTPEDKEGDDDFEEIPDQEGEEEPENPKTPVIKETPKDNIAFATLRKEKQELEKKLKEVQENIKDVAAIAKYSDVDAFLKSVNEAKIKQEAESKGYSIEQYKELQDMRAEVENLKQQNKVVENEKHFVRVQSAMEKVLEDLKGDDNTRTELLDRLEKSGFTSLEQLYNIPNLEPLFKGLMLDKLEVAIQQKELEKEKNLGNIASTPHKGTSADKIISVDDLIAKEMEDIRKEYYS